MAPSRRIVAIVALAALALSACSSNDARESDIVDAMTDAGLDQEQADCIGGRFMEEFDDQDTLNDIASASDPSEYPTEPEGVEDTIDSIIDECVDGAAPTTVPEDTEATDGADGTDTSDTTTGADDATTTTTAG